MLLAALIAQNGTDSRGNPVVSLVPFIALIALFYFLLIRPQRRRMHQQAELIRNLQLGDEVETVAGMFGTVRRMDDESVWLEVAPGTTIRFSRGAVRRRIVEIDDITGGEGTTSG